MADQDNRNRGGSQLDNRDEMKSDGPDNRPIGFMAVVAWFWASSPCWPPSSRRLVWWPSVWVVLGHLLPAGILLRLEWRSAQGEGYGQLRSGMSLLAIAVALFMHGGLSQPFVMLAFRF